MRFVAIVGTEPIVDWPPPAEPVGKKVAIDVDEDTLLNDVIERCVKAAGMPADLDPEFWRYYWLHFKGDNQQEQRYVTAPRTVVAEDGRALWTEGARDQVRIGDLLRTRDAGLMDADPLAAWLEFPGGGDGYIPTWADLIRDLIESGVAAAAVATIRGAHRRWQRRGARTPYGFLDLVFARDKWSRKELGQLLRLGEKETTDVLEAFGFEPAKKDPDRWKVSKDRKRTKLRRKLRHED